MYEPTQKGNPYQITKDQHIHTAHCIGLFEKDGYVQVKEIATGEVLERKKRAAIFCAKRAWDERAEKGYMAKIEDEFHKQVDKAEIGAQRNHLAISTYHLLWFLRHHFHIGSIPDIPLVGISGSGLSKDQSEIVEKKWGGHIRDEGIMPSRFAASIKIQQLIEMNIVQYNDIRWGLVQATEGEFLVADCYQEHCFMPISPKLAFVSQTEDGDVSREDLVALNNTSVSKATNYYFARDLGKCHLC
ncbi:hypothetical protein [Salicola sp. Rm-C-2C1-2]|uniref:hypothetical protein n=1 Tax=Salicola sp. Rm-C-2C1-2 TaxID=3141321 RepID=UPI0032E3F00F